MPEYRTQPLELYVRNAAQGTPTPGGGSVSALVGALASAMAAMAANFTIGKKRFRSAEAEVQALLCQLDNERDAMLDLMQRDTEAYAKVSAAYRMPRGTDAEKQARGQAVQSALQSAMAPPLDVMRCCLRVADAAARLVEIANPNLISDVGVAALLAEAALKGAKLNVDINLAHLDDEALVGRTREEAEALLAKTSLTAGHVASRVNRAINTRTPD